MINKKIVYGSILAFVFLTGCGNDTNSGKFSLSNVEGNKTGVFIDSKVEGVKYITSSGVEGYTNKKGEYKYNNGDEVTFYLGDMNLGSTEASNLTTVFELPDSTKVATLLQLLDKDGNPNNGISISDEDYRIFKNANFELKEVDAQNINFRKKFKDTMGYDIQTDSESIENHALESLKDELVHRYDSDLFKYLNTELKFSGIIGNTIYEKNPNDYLNTYNARLRIYFYAKYIRSAIDDEIELYDNAIRQTEITKEAVDKTAEKLTNNIVKFYSLVGLVKGKYDDLIELKRLKDNIPYSAIDSTNYNNRVRDFAIKKFAHSEGKEALIEFTHKLTGKDTLLGKAISDCVITSKPSALDLLQCESRMAGEAGKQLNGALGEIYKLGYLRTQNGGRLAQDYLDLYYAFNRRTDLVYSIIESMAKEMDRELTFTLDELNKMNISNMTDNDEDILEEILDILSQKRFKNTTRISDEWVAGWQYTFDYSKKMIVEYIKTVDSLQKYFTDTFDKETIRGLDSDYIDFDVQLFPAGGDDLYKIAFQLTNKTPFDLQATRGHVTVELDGKQIDKVVFFKEQVDGKNLKENQLYSESSSFYKSKVFTIPTDKKILTNGVLKVSYKVDYIPSRHNVGEKVQEGVKYYELSKKTLIDDLSKPIIDLNIPKIVNLNETIEFDASKTVSLINDDTFTYKWEYLTRDNDNLELTDMESSIAHIKISNLPDNLAFERHYFRLTVTSNTNGRESVEEFSIFVKNEKKEDETVNDNNTNNQNDNSDTSNNSSTSIDITTLTLQDCKDKTLNQTFSTNTWTTSLSEWNEVHVACLKIFSDNELDNSNVPNSNTDNGKDDDISTTDTPNDSSKTSIDYMKNHKTEKLASTDCKVRNYQGWKDAKNELIYSLAPADNMMKSIEGCIDVTKLTEYGNLSFFKAVESVVSGKAKKSSPFSDIWDKSAKDAPDLTIDDVSDAQNNGDN